VFIDLDSSKSFLEYGPILSIHLTKYSILFWPGRLPKHGIVETLGQAERISMDTLTELLNVQELLTRLVTFLPRLLMAVVMYLGFWVLFRLTRSSIDAILRRSGLDAVLVTLLVDKVYRFVLLTFGLVMAAGQVGINVGAALAGIGVVGIAVGFAAQDLLSNVIAGLVIFWDEPFRVDDFIRIQDQYGRVTDITLRSTRIRTNQNTYVVIPNKNIIDDVLVNHSKHGETRVDVPVGIAYKEQISKARDVLLAAAAGVDGVLDDPDVSVVVEELGSSSVNLKIRVWISEAKSEKPIYFAVLEACKVALDDAGIQIPFPHLQLFVDDVEDRVLQKVATIPQRVAGGGADA